MIHCKYVCLFSAKLFYLGTVIVGGNSTSRVIFLLTGSPTPFSAVQTYWPKEKKH